jgi:GalNAc-alpha-(1->4)-GalNAc-alpha-(1->3)-diNAcBac-PP-undecaprenol alpha-1,4-N-acetyl-D-galactosaminyltransferase
LIPDMGPGGAQRVMAHLMSHFCRRHQITLLTWETTGNVPFYALPSQIRVVQAGLLGGRGVDRAVRIFSRLRVIRREVQRFRPDVVLSFMDTMNIVAIVGCLGCGTPIVISERVDPSQHDIGKARSWLRRWLYPLADCCVVQTEHVKAFFNRPPRPRLAVIPNPVPMPLQQAKPACRNDQGRFRIIAVGRLEKQKGFDLLIDAFAQIALSYPQWDLIIFGEGPERMSLEARVKRYELSGRVYLPGITAHLVAELTASHVMAFPSRYEGFPNALAEGLAAGLPAVGLLGVSGVEELIIDNETGLLVASAGGASALAEVLKRLMDDRDLRVRLGTRAKQHLERWRQEIICEQWERGLVTVTERHKIFEGGARKCWCLTL